jgi:hypothetical protein
MGLFSPKLADSDYFASVAMTYGQAIDAIHSVGAIDQFRKTELHRDLLMVSNIYLEALEADSGFPDMYSFHFECAPSLGNETNVSEFLLTNQDVISEMGAQLAGTFSQSVTRDQAPEVGVQLVDWLSRKLRDSNFQMDIQECGYTIGLAMKTITEDDVRSRRKIAGKRLSFGGILGANWSAVVLGSYFTDNFTSE